MDRIQVCSSHGSLTVDAKTGEVIECRRNDPRDPESDFMLHIRFDVDEWRRAYPDEQIEGMHIDILDLGYWFCEPDGTEVYEPPEEEWRQDFRRTRVEYEADSTKPVGYPLPGGAGVNTEPERLLIEVNLYKDSGKWACCFRCEVDSALKWDHGALLEQIDQRQNEVVKGAIFHGHYVVISDHPEQERNPTGHFFMNRLYTPRDVQRYVELEVRYLAP